MPVRRFPGHAAGSISLTCFARLVIGTLVPFVTISGGRADDVAKGQSIWAEKAGCPQCHGWAGDGARGFHSEGLAPSLRLTELNRDQIRTTIQCGRPATPMPHFDRFAYTDKRCYDMTAEDLGDNVPNRSATTLQPYEVDALADYVATKIKGAGPVSRAACLDYFGKAAGSRCDSYPER